MILFEFEGKELLKNAGIAVPNSQLLDSSGTELPKMTPNFPVVLKAQVLSGKRADAGGILTAVDSKQLTVNSKNLFGKVIYKEKVEKILVEEKAEIEKEIYISISYDSDSRGPILTISEEGGTGIEERGVKVYPVDPLTKTIITQGGLNIDQNILQKLINLFFDQDCLLLEVNPLVKTKEGWMALDAKVKLDDTALNRHKDWSFPPRAVPGYQPSKNEIAAKKIDETDYRGTAGSTYFDFEGDIAVLASGGGASITALDALMKVGGKPANYTEYSGNPPKEKVEKLTQIVLSKSNINALWVVGGVANFTDIYETLSGFVEALKTVTPKPAYPIVIRRGGPRDEEAFEMLRQIKDFDLRLYGQDTSIAKSAEIVTKLAKKYKEKNK